MAIRIQIARTEEDLQAVFRLRHQVYAEEENYFPEAGDRALSDEFDTAPETILLMARDGDELAGVLRFTTQGPLGLPTDEWYDFTPHLPAAGSRLGCASFACVLRKYRGAPRLSAGLMRMGISWSARCGVTHVLGVSNPATVKYPLRIGFRQAAPEGFHAGRGLPFVPVILDMQALNQPERLCAGYPELLPDEDRWCWDLYAPGETIYPQEGRRTGAKILAGRVRTGAPGEGIAELGPGEMLTGDGIALTDVDLWSGAALGSRLLVNR